MKKILLPALAAMLLLSSCSKVKDTVCDLTEKVMSIIKGHDNDDQDDDINRVASNASATDEDIAEPETADPVEAIALQASLRLLDYDDIKDLSKKELRLVRNWIFATHGYKFRSRDLQEYFGDKDWYTPMYSNVSPALSSIERKNVVFIQSYE